MYAVVRGSPAFIDESGKSSSFLIDEVVTSGWPEFAARIIAAFVGRGAVVVRLPLMKFGGKWIVDMNAVVR